MLPLRAELLAAKRRVAERSEAAGTFDALESRRRVRAGGGADGGGANASSAGAGGGIFASSSRTFVRNRGVGERARRDAAAETDRSDRGVRTALERKAALYARLERGETTLGDASFDVDFEAKRIDRHERDRDHDRDRDRELATHADTNRRGGEDRGATSSFPAEDSRFPSTSRFPRDPWAYGDGRGAVEGAVEFGSVGGFGRGRARGREDVERGIAAAAAAAAAAEAAKAAAARAAAEATAAGRVAAADARAEAETLRERRRAKMLLVKRRLEAFHASAPGEEDQR